jgi:hypothetical protein
MWIKETICVVSVDDLKQVKIDVTINFYVIIVTFVYVMSL